MRILLAEDEHTLGTWLCKALEHAGIQVEWVDDGRLADRALQARDHDALVLDLGLPGMDGHTVLQRLRERDQRLLALILTARDSLNERVASLNAGADDFLAKPFALAELEARLHALVRRARRGASAPGLRAAGVRRCTPAVRAEWRSAGTVAARTGGAACAGAAQLVCGARAFGSGSRCCCSPPCCW